jgi:hypothetical protein
MKSHRLNGQLVVPKTKKLRRARRSCDIKNNNVHLDRFRVYVPRLTIGSPLLLRKEFRNWSRSLRAGIALIERELGM